MPDHNIEAYLPPLLRQAAEENIPMSSDLTAAVRRQIDSQPPHRPSGMPRALAATVGAVVVVGLLIILLTHGQRSGGGGTTTIASPTPFNCPGQTNVPPGLACPVTDQGITIQVTGANVSPLGTTIQIVITGPASKINDPSILDDSLTDDQGHIFMSNGDGYQGKIHNHVIGTLSYPPLPIAELQAPIHMTLAITRLYPSVPPAPFVHGLWRSSFVASPVQWEQHAIHMAPVMANGVSVQAQSLEVAPAGETPKGGTGGVRLDLTFTGLPTQTNLSGFELWSPTTHYGCSESPCIATVALLTLPGWSATAFPDLTVIPGNVSMILGAVGTVGPSGTLQVALVYGGTGTPNGQPATLQLNNLRLRDSNGTILRTLPNITLTMPLG